ncbi:MAG: hypothetical protein ACKVS5_16125 [Parvularculaceae bacterium]
MKSAAFQAILVVFGVMLAFAANEWREAAIEHRESGEALASIREELASNRAAAAASKTYHEQRLALIAERAATGEPLSLSDFPRGFISPATLSTAAWSSASETGALANTDYQEIVRLSRVYDMQAVYRDQTVTAGGIIFQRLFDQGVASIPKNAAGLEGVITSFLYRESALIEAYDKATAARD